ncbi:Mu transposase C-terminal domain-containing protein [Catenulispora rubra]|uniref:Mu transposase C-terminal domain-containing protein n=1 Tax=Catenulispora rubra TaxID=280293 RepID=UPI0018927EB5|nr:Mu transposase C-terminal domain-containing protein [Catenulispora rubra]
MNNSASMHADAWFDLDGERVQIVELRGRDVTYRCGDRFAAIGLAQFLARAKPELTVPVDPGLPVGSILSALTPAQTEQVAERAGHVRELLTGYKSGHAATALPSEPRSDYAGTGLMTRYAAKAAELGVTERTVRRMTAAYLRHGEAGLVDLGSVTGRGASLDPRWEDAARQIIAEGVSISNQTDSARILLIETRLDELYGPGVVPLPSRATAYRHLARLAKGTDTRQRPAKSRRSVASRPKGTYGRLRANRPGEFFILDTQSLDVFAMEPVTLRWLPVQLTVALDLFSRCVVAVRVTPVSTKAVDVAGLLYEALMPSPPPLSWADEARWPYHGLPTHLVFDEVEHPDEAPAVGLPGCPPQTLVVDRGKVFLSAHVISVCTRLGISIQPARPRQGSDKPTVERFFRTLREGLIQFLPAYKGPDVYSRGENVEDAAFLFMHELEDVIREWVGLVYHRRSHSGLALGQWPRTSLSPHEMFEIGVARAGLLRISASNDLLYDFLDTRWCTIQHYGVDVEGLRYNGEALDDYRDTERPYGGRYPGKWPVRYNPDDIRTAYFQHPVTGWQPLTWEHAPGIETPFSLEAATYCRRVVLRQGRQVDARQALAELLARWNVGNVLDRRERRMAARLSAERPALPDIDNAPAMVEILPTLVALAADDGTGLGTEPVASAEIESDDDQFDEAGEHDTEDDDLFEFLQ